MCTECVRVQPTLARSFPHFQPVLDFPRSYWSILRRHQQIRSIIYHFENPALQLDCHLLLPFAANHAPLRCRIQIRSDSDTIPIRLHSTDSPDDHKEESHWNYETNGQNWGGVCSAGERQSPISLNVQKSLIVPLPRIVFGNYDVKLRGPITLLNNGHTGGLSFER
ncbi:uncharacterized protein LOC120451070 isoform X2 [Drosophila santomea]|uniref:uncharacterized protein LOC120451070 isoform X2 n=1 Tax=Drosophila santomea TaxID=129105 RepID=UPI0019547FB0|nr:uncharacterized protein LOC120451070 isoform X2 [Drosophila santomea]